MRRIADALLISCTPLIGFVAGYFFLGSFKSAGRGYALYRIVGGGVSRCTRRMGSGRCVAGAVGVHMRRGVALDRMRVVSYMRAGNTGVVSSSGGVNIAAGMSGAAVNAGVCGAAVNAGVGSAAVSGAAVCAGMSAGFVNV